MLMQCHSPKYTGFCCSKEARYLIDYIPLTSIYVLNVLFGCVDTVLHPELHRSVLQQLKHDAWLLTDLLPIAALAVSQICTIQT